MQEKNCEHFEDRIVDAFSGELDSASRQELESHLKSCAHCSATWEDYQSLRRGLQILEKQEQPSELTRARILKAAAQANPSSPKKKPGGVWKFLLSPPTLAAAMVALLVGVGLYSQKWMEMHPEESHPAASHLEKAEPAERARGTTPALPAPKQEQAEKPGGMGMGVSRKAKPAAADVSAPPPVENAVEKTPQVESRIAPLSAPIVPSAGMPAAGGALAPEKEGQTTTLNPTTKSLQQAPAMAPAGQGVMKGEDNIESNRAKLAPEGAAAQNREETPAEQAQFKSDKKKAATTEAKPAADAASQSDLMKMDAKQSEAGFMSEDKAKSAAPSGEKLLSAAKAKIKAGNYSDALQDLLQAQKISDDPEIARLIELCRNKMKPEPLHP